MHCISYKSKLSEKDEICASNSNSMVLRICSRMCMRIEFVIQVRKQKNVHVSFPAGMVQLCFGASYLQLALFCLQLELLCLQLDILLTMGVCG